MTQVTRKLFRAARPDDPGRCQGPAAGGQCPYLSLKACVERGLIDDYSEEEVELSTGCPRHAGGKQATSHVAAQAHDYRIQVWAQRLDEFAESENIHSLRGEIGALRLLVETIFNRCRDTDELILHSSRLAMLCKQLEMTVKTCERIDRNGAGVLGRIEAMQFASEVVNIITRHVSDAAAIDAISNAIMDALVKVTTDRDDESD